MDINFHVLEIIRSLFSLALTDTPDENGEIVGASTYRDFTNCAGRTTIPLLKQERPEDSNYNWFVLTRHPRSSLENGVTRFKNECEATLSGIDGASDNKVLHLTYTYVDPTF